MRASLCLLITLFLSAPAQAANVDVVLDDLPDPDSGTTTFRYRAAPGEDNRLTLSTDRATVIRARRRSEAERGPRVPGPGRRVGIL